MRKTISIKEVGLITGYVFLLIGVIFFGTRPLAVFLSFVLEFIVLLVVYVLIYRHDKRIRPSNQPPVMNIIQAGLGLALFQGLPMVMIGLWLESELTGKPTLADVGWLALSLGLPLLGFYLFDLNRKKWDQSLIDERMAQLFTSALAIFAINMTAIVYIGFMGDNGVGTIVIVLISARVAVELWMNHGQKPRPNQSPKILEWYMQKRRSRKNARR